MTKATYTFSLDIHESVAQHTLSMKQGETGRRMKISLREDGEPYIPASDCIAVVYARKPNNSTIINNCGISLSDGVVTYDCSAELCTSIGIAECELRIYGADGNLICSPTFLVNVNSVPITDSTITSNNDLRAITDVIYNYKTLSGNIIWTNLESGTYICNNAKIYTQAAYDSQGQPLLEFATGIVKISVIDGTTSADNVVSIFRIKVDTVSGVEKFAVYTCKIDDNALGDERTFYIDDLEMFTPYAVSTDKIINEIGVGAYRVVSSAGKGIKYYESGLLSKKLFNGILFVTQTPLLQNKSWWFCGTIDSGQTGGKINGCVYGVYYGNSVLNTSVYEYENANNKVTFISSDSTDTEYPTAKAVYDLVQTALYVEGSDTV